LGGGVGARLCGLRLGAHLVDAGIHTGDLLIDILARGARAKAKAA